MKIIVQTNQTLADICTQFLGDTSQMAELVRINGLAHSAVLLSAGTHLDLPEVREDKKAVVQYFSSRSISIATRA